MYKIKAFLAAAWKLETFLKIFMLFIMFVILANGLRIPLHHSGMISVYVTGGAASTLQLDTSEPISVTLKAEEPIKAEVSVKSEDPIKVEHHENNVGFSLY